MKILGRIVVVLVSLLVIAGVIGYFTVDGILKRTIEKQSTNSLKLTTTLNSSHLSLLGGKVKLNKLGIASPQGFSAPRMLEMHDIDLAVSYDQLRKDPIHVQSLVLNQPKLVIEQSGGAVNFKKAMDRLPPSNKSSKEPVKLIIDDLRIQDAQVFLHPGLPGLREEIEVKVPSIALKNVGSGGGSQNGAAIKDVAMMVMSALAAKAAESGSLPAELRAVLQFNAGQVAGKLGAEVQKQIAAALPGELGKKLPNIDTQSLMKDPGKTLEGELGGILGGKKDTGAAGRAGPTKR
jgi:uncharacterized protein involved in outer membrane biogenesis